MSVTFKTKQLAGRILELYQAGHSQSEIGRMIGLPSKTINWHVRRLRKTGQIDDAPRENHIGDWDISEDEIYRRAREIRIHHWKLTEDNIPANGPKCTIER